MDFHLTIACPEGYEPNKEILTSASSNVTLVRDPVAACKDADLITTDVWASMGQEDEAEERREAFSQYQVTQSLMKLAKPDVLFLHCLPAHRGEEVSAEVIDAPDSVVWDQAGNRLHAQKALIEMLLKINN